MQLASNLNTIIDKDLANLFILRVNRETEQAAFTASLEFAILHRQLEDLPFDGLTGGQAGHHLDLTPEVSAGLLLLIGGLIPGRCRHRIALLDDEQGVLAPGQGATPIGKLKFNPGNAGSTFTSWAEAGTAASRRAPVRIETMRGSMEVGGGGR